MNLIKAALYTVYISRSYKSNNLPLLFQKNSSQESK